MKLNESTKYVRCTGKIRKIQGLGTSQRNKEREGNYIISPYPQYKLASIYKHHTRMLQNSKMVLTEFGNGNNKK